MPSDQPSPKNYNFVITSKKQLILSLSALYHLKTRVCLKYFVNDCNYVLEIMIHKNQGRLILSWRRPLSYRNQTIDLVCNSMDWFLYDNGLRHERVSITRIDFLNVFTKRFYDLYLLKYIHWNRALICFKQQISFLHLSKYYQILWKR